MLSKKKIIFHSTLNGTSWGGSEELWSKAAIHMLQNGHAVSASVNRGPTLAPRIQDLVKQGMPVIYYDKWDHVAIRVANKLCRSIGLTPFLGSFTRIKRQLNEIRPDLIVVSQGGLNDGLDIMELALDLGIPYVSIIQANSESFWPHDELADRHLRVARQAKHNYFVSLANQNLFFLQIGTRLDNCSVVSNPPNLFGPLDVEWPQTDVDLSLACVARLNPAAKGQDLILQVLSQHEWRERNVRVHLYGTGSCEQSLRRLTSSLELDGKVVFEGHVSDVRQIWAKHHALVLPSRYEGTPLALIEAMQCSRTAITTAVAGIPELVDDGVNGFVALAATLPLFADAMERAWTHRNRMREFGLKAREAIERKQPADPVRVFVDDLISQL